MKILHFADAHIGVSTHGVHKMKTGNNDRVDDFLLAFDFIIDYVEANGIDLVLFAGDMFHTNKPSPSLISAVTLRVREIADLCPIVIIPGNHDQAANRVSAVQFLEEIKDADIYVTDKPMSLDIPVGVDGQVCVCALPYPRAYDYDCGNNQLELMDAVNTTIESWMEYKPVDIPFILLAHISIQGAQYGAYRPSVLGSDAHLLLEQTADFDYVALGHIHKHQNVTAGMIGLPPVVYPGSIERIDFGEETEPKGFVVIDFQNGVVEHTFVEIPARPMLTLRYDGITIDEICADIRKHTKLGHIHPDSLVRVIVNTDKPMNTQPIEDALSSVYRVASINVQVKLDREEGRLPVLSLVGMDDTSLLEEWCLLHDIADDDIDVLVEMFEQIKQDVN